MALNRSGRIALRVIGAIVVVALLWLAWIAAHIGWYRYQPPGRLQRAKAPIPVRGACCFSTVDYESVY